MVTPNRHDPVSDIRGGAGVFAFVVLTSAILLLVLFPAQTDWIDKQPIFRQPAFWPVAALAGMALFMSFVCFRTWKPRQSGHRPAVLELLQWARAIEYAVWFMAYVFIVPLAGYLLATVGFCILLSLRAGYHSRRFTLYAALSGLATVLVFKTFLSVKIPGGAVYEYLPAALRNVMILYF